MLCSYPRVVSSGGSQSPEIGNIVRDRMDSDKLQRSVQGHGKVIILFRISPSECAPLCMYPPPVYDRLLLATFTSLVSSDKQYYEPALQMVSRQRMCLVRFPVKRGSRTRNNFGLSFPLRRLGPARGGIFDFRSLVRYGNSMSARTTSFNAADGLIIEYLSAVAPDIYTRDRPRGLREDIIKPQRFRLSSSGFRETMPSHDFDTLTARGGQLVGSV